MITWAGDLLKEVLKSYETISSSDIIYKKVVKRDTSESVQISIPTKNKFVVTFSFVSKL